MGEDEKKAEISTPEPTTDIKTEEKKSDDDKQSDPTPESMNPEISQEIITNMASRLRFYFSDASLRRDNFLRRIVMDDKIAGFAPIATLLTFNTIKQVSPEPQALVRAVQEDEKLMTLLKLNEDQTSIARIKPFTMDLMKKEVGVTLRVSGIPMKGDPEDYAVKREDVEDAFKEFGYVAMVRMLYNYKRGDTGVGSRTAIGRAFVEMETEEGMQNAVAALCLPDNVVKVSDEEAEKTETKEEQPKRTLKLGGTEVRIKTMQQWFDQRETKRIARFGSGGGRGGGGRGGGGRGRGVGRGSGRGYMDKSEQRNQGGEKRNAKGVEKRARDNEVKQDGDKIDFKLDWKKGCVISVKGLPDGCDRETILASVTEVVGKDVKFRADYSRGQKDGAIRFEQPNEKIAELAAKMKDGTVMVKGCKVESATVIDGEDEEKYYKEYIAFKTKQFQTKAEEKQHKRSRRR